ncbi:MAG: xanthine dehydrogenase family protein subunit M [Pseudomonadota bacterium]
MYDFDLSRPKTVAEAVSALAVEEAQALGGGQTLIPTLKQRLASPSVLVSLGAVAELQEIFTDRSGSVTIGGAVTHAAVAAGVGSTYPALADMAAHIGDPAVRNRGTLGGSLANNDPSACYPAAVLGSGATVQTNSREIAANDYFEGMFATALDEGEIITAVHFPCPDKACYKKFVQPASRFALVGAFVWQKGGDVRVAITGASNDGVFRWAEAEAALASDFNAGALEGLSLDGSNMISDLHGTGAYRAHIAKVMTQRAVTDAH